MNALKRASRLVFGVTGGIAAYKAVECLRLLRKRGCDVRVVMTRNACRFVGLQTFQALTGNPVVHTMFSEIVQNESIQHTSLADWADAAVIAPASANILGKYANGIADDFLSTFLLAFSKPVLMAPAMNPAMFAHPAVQQNLSVLSNRGVCFAGPDSGDVACGHTGTGRMSSPDMIADLTYAMLGRNGDYAGKKILVSAGPTREWIDPVRYMTNRSSGKMGYALAAAAAERGALVTLVSGPVHLKPHAAVTCKQTITASDMMDTMTREAKDADVVIMAAAVSDWRPETVHEEKWKKDDPTATTLSLVKNADIVQSLSENKTENQIVIGFAAETTNHHAEAMRKRHEKKLDAIIVNDVSKETTGFDSDFNQGFWIDREDRITEIPMCSKREMADIIFDLCKRLVNQ